MREWRTHLTQPSWLLKMKTQSIYVSPLHIERTNVREGKEPFQFKKTMIKLAQKGRRINWP